MSSGDEPIHLHVRCALIESEVTGDEDGCLVVIMHGH